MIYSHRAPSISQSLYQFCVTYTCLLCSLAGIAVAWLPTSVVAQDCAEKTVVIQEKYLILPICNTTEKKIVHIMDENGVRLYNFDATISETPEKTDWHAFLDMSEYAGQSLKIQVLPQNERCSREMAEAALSLLAIQAEVPRREPLYAEKWRPQFHVSQMQGWNNDPNGMVFWNGEYHLFWQSNPVGLPWSNMFWGHAVTRDLVHWEELPLALRPFGNNLPPEKREKSMANGSCFSGTATPAWDVEIAPEKEAERPLYIAFTDTASGEALAVSYDQGRTWEYDSVKIPHRGRDPQMIWFPNEKKWVLPVYEEDGSGRERLEQMIAFYQSTDRQNWERTGEIRGYFECPNLYQLPVDGNTDNMRWVIWAANGQYAVGNFDGKTFVPENADDEVDETRMAEPGKHRVHYGNFYASQCFNNTPGRLIQIGWAQIGIPFEAKQPFNQTFTLPIELTLRTTRNGVRLFAEPVKELEVLRGEERKFTGKINLNVGENGDKKAFGDGQLYELCVTIDSEKDADLLFGKSRIHWNSNEKKLDEMPLTPQDGKITFRVWIDRPMYEICANNGEAYKTCFRQDGGEKLPSIELLGSGSVTIWTLRGIYGKK